MAVNDISQVVGGLTAIIKKDRIVALYSPEDRVSFFITPVPGNTLPYVTMEESFGGETFTLMNRNPVFPESLILCFSLIVDIEEIFESAARGYIKHLKTINNRVPMNAIDRALKDCKIIGDMDVICVPLLTGNEGG